MNYDYVDKHRVESQIEEVYIELGEHEGILTRGRFNKTGFIFDVYVEDEFQYKYSIGCFNALIKSYK